MQIYHHLLATEFRDFAAFWAVRFFLLDKFLAGVLLLVIMPALVQFLVLLVFLLTAEVAVDNITAGVCVVSWVVKGLAFFDV